MRSLIVLIWLLASLGGCSRATPQELIGALEDPATAEEAIAGLVAHGAKAVPLLLTVAATPELPLSSPMRAGALQALVHIGAPALEPLRRMRSSMNDAERSARETYAKMALLGQEGTAADLESQRLLSRVWAVQRDLETAIDLIEGR